MEKERIKRLLCIVSSMNAGGAETFLMKFYRVMDKTKYQMDFYCMSSGRVYYEDEIINLGGRIFHGVCKSENFIKSFLDIKHTVQDHNYKYVLRVSQHSLATIDLIAAKFGGATVLIQRSSNADSAGSLSKVLHHLFKLLPIITPTLKIAPSTEAAEYTFGKKCIDNKEAVIVKNAIPIDSFIFDEHTRTRIRDEFNIENNLVIGHVGRFSKQKNHTFVIDIFVEILRQHENSILLLIGKGELEDDLRNKIEKLGFSDKVIFAGVRSDIPAIMMAMDVFVFPSYYEGMPNTVIEAQATGLPCIISDTITKEAAITELVSYKSIESHPKEWANAVMMARGKFIRSDMRIALVASGYDIQTEIRRLERLVFHDNRSTE